MSTPQCDQTLEVPMVGSPPVIVFVCAKLLGHGGEHDWRPKS